jgi:cytochrome-b5 reductase
LIRKIFSDKNTKDTDTKVTLIFANQTEEDILIRDELEGYAKKYPDRFKLVHALDRPSKNWTGHVGFVTSDLVKEHLPGPDTPDTIVFCCGPDAMLAALAGAKAPDKSQGPLGGILKQLNYPQDKVYKF